MELLYFTVVVHGGEICSPTLREGNVEVFDSRTLRIFGPKKQKVTRGRRKLHNKLHHLFVVLLKITIKSKRKRRTRHVNGNESRNVSYIVFWLENLK